MNLEKNILDQTGHAVHYPSSPRRIISIVPSQTELLFHLGLGDCIVGVTKFCVHPKDECKSKAIVGGTKQLHIDRIAVLQPDLIIGNKEENDRSQIEQLRKQFPVWLSDIVTLEDAFSMMLDLGKITERSPIAEALVSQLRKGFSDLRKNVSINPIRAAYLIWYKPWMVAATATFINSVMEAAGFENVFANKTRYPEITLEELAEANPAAILLSTEPFPFKEKHVEEIKRICPKSIIKIVDGEMFSWYGSRMLHAATYLSNLRFVIAPTSKL